MNYFLYRSIVPDVFTPQLSFGRPQSSISKSPNAGNKSNPDPPLTHLPCSRLTPKIDSPGQLPSESSIAHLPPFPQIRRIIGDVSEPSSFQVRASHLRRRAGRRVSSFPSLTWAANKQASKHAGPAPPTQLACLLLLPFPLSNCNAFPSPLTLDSISLPLTPRCIHFYLYFFSYTHITRRHGDEKEKAGRGARGSAQ
jgi:hypothetical protein